eukprot:Gb_31330 [translate_table: standard]
MAMVSYPLPRPTAMPRVSYHRLKMNNASTGHYLSFSYKKPINVGVRAQLVDLKATRKVDIPFREGGGAGEDYIKEIERIVHVTFPDSARIKYVGDNVWRARLRPVTFFSITATPFCDVKVFHYQNSLQLLSNKLILDFIGFPGNLHGLDLNFSLQGELIVNKELSTVADKEQTPSFKGWVTMGLKVDLPLPFSLMPNSIIVPVGNGILDRILGAMEGALVSRIIRDYNTWCQKFPSQQPSAIPQPLFH